MPINLSYEALKELISWVNIELCSETKHILMYPPNNLKFVYTSSQKLNEDFKSETTINYVADNMMWSTHPLISNLKLW